MARASKVQHFERTRARHISEKLLPLLRPPATSAPPPFGSGLILTPSSAASPVCTAAFYHLCSKHLRLLTSSPRHGSGTIPKPWWSALGASHFSKASTRIAPSHASTTGEGKETLAQALWDARCHLALQDRHLGHRKERWQGRWMGRDSEKNTTGSRTTSLTDCPADQS